MSSTPVKELPASSSVSSPCVPVANRGGEEVDVSFSYFGTGGRNKLRDPGLGRSAGHDREFSFGNRFHMSPLPYHIKDVMFYTLGVLGHDVSMLCKALGEANTIVAMQLTTFPSKNRLSRQHTRQNDPFCRSLK